MSRRNVVFGLVVLLVIGAITLIASNRNQNRQTASSVESAIIQRTSVDLTVEGAGVVTPERTVFLTFGMADAVSTVDVAVGDSVTMGQLLASLDTTELELQVALAEQTIAAQQASYDLLLAGASDADIAQAEASVAQAQANLATATAASNLTGDQVTIQCAGLVTAQDGLNNALEAYDDYVMNGLELDPTFMPDPDSPAGVGVRDAQTNYDVAQAQCDVAVGQDNDTSNVDAARAALAQSEARLEGLLTGPIDPQIDAALASLETARVQMQQAESRLNDAVLVAPFDGIVTAVEITEAQRVNTGTIAVTIADVSKLHLELRIDELDISSVNIGQSVTIQLDAVPEGQFVGEVTHIAPSGQLVQGIVTYEVRVDLIESSPEVLLGMSADAEILVDSLIDVLVVPRAAIQRSDELGEYVIVAQSTGNITEVPVTTGISVDGTIVIEGNLAEGQTVLLSEPVEVNRSGLFGG